MSDQVTPSLRSSEELWLTARAEVRQAVEQFVRRDDNEVQALNDRNPWGGMPGIEDRLAFSEARLRDVCGLVVFALKRLSQEHGAVESGERSGGALLHGQMKQPRKESHEHCHPLP
jgi:hypothetical protein